MRQPRCVGRVVPADPGPGRSVGDRLGYPHDDARANPETRQSPRFDAGGDMEMSPAAAADRVREILAAVKPLAAEFYRLSGKPLGALGVSEFKRVARLVWPRQS